MPQPAPDPVAVTAGPPPAGRRSRPAPATPAFVVGSPGARVQHDHSVPPAARAARRVSVKSAERRSRAAAGSTRGQAESLERPLWRRAARIARPARVRMRRRKPWVLARRRLLGWNVRLLTRGLPDWWAVVHGTAEWCQGRWRVAHGDRAAIPLGAGTPQRPSATRPGNGTGGARPRSNGAELTTHPLVPGIVPGQPGRGRDDTPVPEVAFCPVAEE